MRHKGKKLHYSGTLPPDILRELPRNVIDEILMCLPFRDVVRTSILSKKWRYIWCSLPKLAFSNTRWKPDVDLADLTSNLIKIVDDFLIFHAGPVTDFTLCVPYLDMCPNIDNLIHFLSRNGIQHLVLRLSIRGIPYKLPSSFFTCFQLRHLTLQNCSILHQPASKGFHQLISLELRDVTISAKLLERLISRCLLLKQLSHSEFWYFPPSPLLQEQVECDDNYIPALESLEVERFSDVTFNHLKEVKLIQTNGTIPEMQLMKLLLAKSPELMRMLIEPCLVEEFATVKIFAELTKFQRASPKAEVVYKLHKCFGS